MKKKRFIQRWFLFIKKELSYFIHDEFGGNLVEYALLIGLALFIFFIIVGIITSLLDWTMNQTNSFLDGFFLLKL